MKKPIAIINHTQTDTAVIVYNLTNVCNYKCNYCWPESHSGTTRWPDYDKVCKSFDHMISVYKNDLGKKTVRFHFLGGEPTLWPKLGEFAKYIFDRHGCRITMATNGSRTLRWWEENADYFDDVQLSVHHEECDIEHLKKVADLIYAKQNTMVSLAVMMDPQAWNKCVNLLNELVNHPTPWLVKTIILRETDDDVVRNDYTPEQEEFTRDKIKKLPPAEYIKKMQELNAIQSDYTDAYTHFDDGTVEKYNTFEILKNRWNSFLGWTCNLFQDVIAVAPNGDVLGNCGVAQFPNVGRISLYDEDFADKFTAEALKPVKCPIPFCGCPTDVRLTKYKIKPEHV